MTIQIEPQHALSPSEIDEIEDRLYEHNSYVTGCHDGQGLGFVIRGQLGQMIGAAGVIEIVFNRPGLGKLLIDAILQRDYPLSQALIAVLLVAVILINLMTDVLYGLVDPRVRHA